MKRHRNHVHKPEQTICGLCERLFAYFRTTKPRLYCAPCVEIERKAANTFHNGLVSLARRQARAA